MKKEVILGGIAILLILCVKDLRKMIPKIVIKNKDLFMGIGVIMIIYGLLSKNIIEGYGCNSRQNKWNDTGPRMQSGWSITSPDENTLCQSSDGENCYILDRGTYDNVNNWYFTDQGQEYWLNLIRPPPLQTSLTERPNNRDEACDCPSGKQFQKESTEDFLMWWCEDIEDETNSENPNDENPNDEHLHRCNSDEWDELIMDNDISSSLTGWNLALRDECEELGINGDKCFMIRKNNAIVDQEAPFEEDNTTNNNYYFWANRDKYPFGLTGTVAGEEIKVNERDIVGLTFKESLDSDNNRMSPPIQHSLMYEPNGERCICDAGYKLMFNMEFDVNEIDPERVLNSTDGYIAWGCVPETSMQGVELPEQMRHLEHAERIIDEFPKCNSPDFDTSSYEPFFSLVPHEHNRLEECGPNIGDNEHCFKQHDVSDEYGLSEYEKYNWRTRQTPGGGKVSPPLYNTLTRNKISGCICDPENNEKMLYNTYPPGYPRWSCQSKAR